MNEAIKIKILYLITNSDVGGAQKYIRDLSENLDPMVFETKCIYGGRDVQWLSNRVYPWLLFFNDWCAIAELVRVFRREQPNIIHLNSSKAGVLGAVAASWYNLLFLRSRFSRIRVVFTAHGWVFNPTNALVPLVRLAYIALHWCAALFQDSIICVSEHDRQLAIRYHIAPQRKLATIHNGIDSAYLNLANIQATRLEIMRRMGSYASMINPHAPWVGSLGRITKEKHYETLIAAAALNPLISFFIIGKGSEKPRLEAMIRARKIENLFFVAPQGNDARLLGAFDCFVMTSIKEGFPYVLLEAMGAGLPIIVTNAGGMAEAITHMENGIVIAQKDTDALTNHIRDILKNKQQAQTLGKRAKTTVQERFSLASMVAKTSTLYRAQTANL